jgi:ABC-type spermidine/putrescine transport system permease subunit II
VKRSNLNENVVIAALLLAACLTHFTAASADTTNPATGQIVSAIKRARIEGIAAGNPSLASRFVVYRCCGASPSGIIAAHVVVTGPYVVRTVGASLAGFDRSLEQAAMTLGAGRLRTFAHVTFPLILPGVAAGALFAFIVSFDELTVTLFVTGPRLATLPIRIYNHITYITDPLVAAVSALLVFLTIGIVLLLERLVGLDRLLGTR